MRSFALRTTTNPFKTHSAWVPGSGLVQIAVSSMLRLDCPPSPQLYLRSTVDTALQIYRQLRCAHPASGIAVEGVAMESLYREVE
jgi:hypothetical protein